MATFRAPMPISRGRARLSWPSKLGAGPNCRAIAVGAGRTLDPDWMKGRPGEWENELMPTGHVAAYSVPLVSGAFPWGSRVYR